MKDREPCPDRWRAAAPRCRRCPRSTDTQPRVARAAGGGADIDHRDLLDRLGRRRQDRRACRRRSSSAASRRPRNPSPPVITTFTCFLVVPCRLSALMAPTYSGAATEALEARAYRKVTLRLLPFLMLCYVAAYLDRVNVGFAKLEMLGDLGFSETAYGLGRRHVLHRLFPLRGAEQHHPPPRRRAHLDRPHHDHAGGSSPPSSCSRRRR